MAKCCEEDAESCSRSRLCTCVVQELSLRVTVAETTDDGRGENLGHVIIGPEASGMGITHWNQMLATLRKPVSMWHPLRRI